MDDSMIFHDKEGETPYLLDYLPSVEFKWYIIIPDFVDRHQK